jgi:hypothetical protein
MLSTLTWRSEPTSNSPPSNGSAMLGSQRKTGSSTVLGVGTKHPPALRCVAATTAANCPRRQ